jgi:mRNA interferase MazF
VKSYVPRRGDLVWLDFTPQAGPEQTGRRPALTLSPEDYNRRVGLALFCPITSQRKGYPFEAALTPGLAVGGVVLSDQVKSLDWRIRGAEFADQVPNDVMEEVSAKAAVLIHGR